MKTLAITISLSLLTTAILSAQSATLPRGESVVDAPAVGDGLCVHNLFQSNMVLQRDRPIKIWGWAAAGEAVRVSFAGQQQDAVAADDRSWSVTFPAMPTNSSGQEMVVKGASAELKLENILLGDVWILGGQSNMEFPLYKVEHGNLEIVSANFDGIRILTIPKQLGPDPRVGFPRLHEWSSWSSRHFRKGDWDVCSPEIVRELSAIGYVFARRLHMASQVPIGVIDASVGGTTVETWTPTPVLEAIDTPEVQAKLAEWETKVAEFDPQKDLTARIEKHHAWVANREKRGEKIPDNRKEAPSDLRPGPAYDQNRPGNCYNNLIHPIAGLAVKGAIFHQGYNNAFSGSAGAAMYYQIFGKMIGAWRSAFGDPEMPFGIISLCTDGEMQTRDNYVEKMVNTGMFLREAQYKTFLDLRGAGDQHIGFASSFDMRRTWYHPQKKLPVGERIAGWALATQYGFEKEIRWLPPQLESMEVLDGKITLRLDSRVFAPEKGPIEGFAIAGEDRRFQPAEAQYFEKGKDSRGRPQYDKQVLVLSSPHVPDPKHFRYAWGRNPMGNLKSEDNALVPFATQRSDDWKLEETPSTDPDKEWSARQAQKELRLDDLGRRLEEARAFIEEHQEAYEKERAAREEK